MTKERLRQQIKLKILSELANEEEATENIMQLIDSYLEQLSLCGVSNSLVADIRNKLTPINNLVAMIEDTNAVLLMDERKAKFINTEIAKVKYTIEYLSNL